MDTIRTMPGEDSADVFLHHRDAVLEALLSDSSFGAETHEVQRPPLEHLQSGEFGSAEAPPIPGPEPISSPGGGRPGPTASERILALLNGQGADAFEPMNAASSLPETSPAKPAAGASSPAEPPAARRTATRFSASARDLLARVRNPKVALGIGGAVVVMLIVALTTTGGRERPAAVQSALATTAAGPTATAAPTTTAPSVGSAVEVKSAQSHCPPGGTPAMDAFAGAGKAWSCPRAYKVDGEILTIDLGRSYRIDSIGLVPGWDSIGSDGVDQWTKYRTTSRVSYRFDDPNSTTYTQQTLDQRTLVVTKVNPEVSATRIVLTVLASKGDPTVNTIALSSIVITGH
ncbi:hypothetical protein ACFXO9_31010 [Nocardia tengchongensis]|uniref:hypothetical protein n=1 Tax=Nocardia tengchongensis TaxID=2055889 RepID=UPI0036ACACAF